MQSYKRACDLCGWNGPANQLTPVGNGLFHCRDDRNNWTAEQTRRHNRPRRPLLIKSRKNARITGEVPLYQQDEGELFNLVVKFATTASVIGHTGATITGAVAQVYADCGVYLRELLLEDKRPLKWMTQGLARLKSIGTVLIVQQIGSPTSGFPSEATSSVRYGGIAGTSTSQTPQATAAAGLVFLALATLDPTNGNWIAAADRCAWFMRQIQRADLLSSGPVVDSNGTAVFVGGWPEGRGIFTGTMSPLYYTSNAWCLWFMARYRDVRGAAYVLGTTTAAGDFTSAPSGTVQQTIDDALAFYVTGRFPYSTTTTPSIAPLSSETPQSLCTPASAARFSQATSGGYCGVSGLDMAMALRGLYELEGYTARVATIFEWLMGFSSNALYETPVSSTPVATPLTVLRTGLTGEYDPAVGMADFLALGTSQASAPTLATNGSSLYSLPATAVLGPVYNASKRLLRTWKDELSKSQPLTSDPRDVRSLRPYDTVGLSFQLGVTSTQGISMATVARNALIYRAAPGRFNELRGLA